MNPFYNVNNPYMVSPYMQPTVYPSYYPTENQNPNPLTYNYPKSMYPSSTQFNNYPQFKQEEKKDDTDVAFLKKEIKKKMDELSKLTQEARILADIRQQKLNNSKNKQNLK